MRSGCGLLELGMAGIRVSNYLLLTSEAGDDGIPWDTLEALEDPHRPKMIRFLKARKGERLPPFKLSACGHCLRVRSLRGCRRHGDQNACLVYAIPACSLRADT